MKRKSMTKKLASIVLGISLLIPTAVGAWSAPVQAMAVVDAAKTKEGSSHWAGTVLNEWKNKGYIKGDADGNLHPDNQVTRSELAALINRSFQVKETQTVTFKDITGQEWFYSDLSKAVANGYMKGYTDGTFKPNAKVTRQELAVILTNLLKLAPSDAANRFNDTSNSPAWSKGAIGAVIDQGLMKGNGSTFSPLKLATRAEVVTVLDRALTQYSGYSVTYDKEGVYGPSEGTETIQSSVRVTTAGVTLKNLVIEGNLLLAEGIGEGDVTLDHVTVKGTTSIEGGGKNSIHVLDSVLITVIVNKKDGSIRIVAEGNSVVSQVTLRSGAILEESGLTGAGFESLILSEQMPAGSQVSLAGTFETVDVVATQLKIDLTSGSIGELTVGETAIGSEINIQASALISSLILNASVNVSGQGQIGHAEINASGSTLAQRPNSISFNNNSSAIIAGQPNSTNSGSGNSGSGSGSGGGATTTPVTNHLVVTNGKAVLKFIGTTPSLTREDLLVTASVAGATYELKSLAYNPINQELSFDPIPMEDYYGKQLTIQVSPSSGVTAFNGILSGSVRIEGFAGTIVDVDDNAVEGMTIQFRRGLGNTSGAVVATVVTDSSGRYSINLPAGIYTGEMNKAGFITGQLVGVSASSIFNRNENATAIKVPKTGELRIVLTWGEKPRDEDSHLVGPTPGGTTFHTWYADREHYFNGELYADLDHDDVTSYGPETTTIRKRIDGVYTFYVHNYSRNGADGTETLRNSGAKVEIYDASGTPLKTYHIPAGSGDELYWYVFDMTIAGGQITFADKNTLTNNEPSGHQPEVDEEYQTLLDEAAKLPSVTEVTYDTELNTMIPLTDANNPLMEGTNLKIVGIYPISVTDDVYIASTSELDAILFTEYNDSEEEAEYYVEIELSRGEFSVVTEVYITIPTLKTLLYNAIEAARPLAVTNQALSNQIVATESLLTNGGSTEDKKAALRALLNLMI